MNLQTRTTKLWIIGAPAALFAVGAFSPSLLASQILKFSQSPMLDTRLIDDTGLPRSFHGHDELSTAWSRYPTDLRRPLEGYFGQLMADDFADRFNSPVVHLRWWGSYLNGPLQGVDKFLVSFSADVPARPGANAFSHPGPSLLNQVVTRGPLAPGSGTFSEQQVYLLSVDGPIYEYNAELYLGKEFHQNPDTVYWLTIAALVDTTATNPMTDPNVIRWGWHNRDYATQNPLASIAPAVTPGEFADRPLPAPTNAGVWHFQDDAVSGAVAVTRGRQGAGFLMPIVQQSNFVRETYEALVDGPREIGLRSKDLAFELYTVPEPASIALVCCGVAMISALARLRRRHARSAASSAGGLPFASFPSNPRRRLAFGRLRSWNLTIIGRRQLRTINSSTHSPGEWAVSQTHASATRAINGPL